MNKLVISCLFLFPLFLLAQTAPPNDTPTGAIALPNIGDPCTFISGTTVWATSENTTTWGYSGPTCADASCSGGVTAFPKEVFYKFNSFNYTEVNIFINAPSQIGTVGLIRVFESSNGINGFSMHSCVCSPSSSLPITSYTVSGLNPNKTYYIAVSPKVGTTGFWTDFEICVSTTGPAYVTLSPKVFLQGAFSGMSMTTDLNPTMIPLTSPYADAKPLNSTLPTNAVDWIWVELRSDDTNAPTTVDGQSGILLSDGTVINPDGTNLSYQQSPGSSWYIVIKHRNHLGVMTAMPVLFN